jgi:hypothetical protein
METSKARWQMKSGTRGSTMALALMVLPLLAGAQGREPPMPEEGSFWFDFGLGQALLHSASARGSGSTLNISAGWTVAPHWALGAQVGMTSNNDGCEVLECDDLGPDVSHLMLVAEYIPSHSFWRPRLAAGTFEYCTTVWFYSCDTAEGPGVGLYATRQWPLTRQGVWSVGLRLGTEVAYLPAKHSTQTPGFWHAAGLLSVQFKRN